MAQPCPMTQPCPMAPCYRHLQSQVPLHCGSAGRGHSGSKRRPRAQSTSGPVWVKLQDPDCGRAAAGCRSWELGGLCPPVGRSWGQQAGQGSVTVRSVHSCPCPFCHLCGPYLLVSSCPLFLALSIWTHRQELVSPPPLPALAGTAGEALLGCRGGTWALPSPLSLFCQMTPRPHPGQHQVSHTTVLAAGEVTAGLCHKGQAITCSFQPGGGGRYCGMEGWWWACRRPARDQAALGPSPGLPWACWLVTWAEQGG